MSHVIKQPPPKAFALENGELGGGGIHKNLKIITIIFKKTVTICQIKELNLY